MTQAAPLNVLHVNDADLRGKNFNGYDLLVDLRRYGIRGKQAVLNKLSDNPDVFSLCASDADRRLHDAVWRVEIEHSMNDVLFPWGKVLAESDEFQRADVVHFHLIHNQTVSLPDLATLCAAKPCVWTFHDSWPITGHCIQPGACRRWLDGCEVCPDLNAGFVLKEDRANRMWRLKQGVFENLEVDVIVASEMMRENVRCSPITAHLEHVHLVPFGVDSSSFAGDGSVSAAREALGVPLDDYVIMCRSSPQGLKGLPYLIEALELGPPGRATTLLTVDQPGLVVQLEPDYGIVELGWVDDSELYRQAFTACDVFVMPSTAEGFGLMALEAMASARPVVCFEGTTLPWITHAPECGIAVPMGDARALRAALDALAESPEDAQRRGALGRVVTETEFSHDAYLSGLADVYRGLAARRRATT
ncbi:MAG: glycosyltransferase [Coriobacteriia bacterium]|nr:glycosyltransferase [Coriobacteriia bacterium]